MFFFFFTLLLLYYNYYYFNSKIVGLAKLFFFFLLNYFIILWGRRAQIHLFLVTLECLRPHMRLYHTIVPCKCCGSCVGVCICGVDDWEDDCIGCCCSYIPPPSEKLEPLVEPNGDTVGKPTSKIPVLDAPIRPKKQKKINYFKTKKLFKKIKSTWCALLRRRHFQPNRAIERNFNWIVIRRMRQLSKANVLQAALPPRHRLQTLTQRVAASQQYVVGNSQWIRTTTLTCRHRWTVRQRQGIRLVGVAQRRWPSHSQSRSSTTSWSTWKFIKLIKKTSIILFFFNFSNLESQWKRLPRSFAPQVEPSKSWCCSFGGNCAAQRFSARKTAMAWRDRQCRPPPASSRNSGWWSRSSDCCASPRRRRNRQWADSTIPFASEPNWRFRLARFAGRDCRAPRRPDSPSTAKKEIEKKK